MRRRSPVDPRKLGTAVGRVQRPLNHALDRENWREHLGQRDRQVPVEPSAEEWGVLPHLGVGLAGPPPKRCQKLGGGAWGGQIGAGGTAGGNLEVAASVRASPMASEAQYDSLRCFQS